MGHNGEIKEQDNYLWQNSNKDIKLNEEYNLIRGM